MVIFFIDLLFLSLLAYAALSDLATTYLPDKEISYGVPLLIFLKAIYFLYSQGMSYAVEFSMFIFSVVLLTFIMYRLGLWASGEIFLLTLLFSYLYGKISFSYLILGLLITLFLWDLLYLFVLLIIKGNYFTVLFSFLVSLAVYYVTKLYLPALALGAVPIVYCVLRNGLLYYNKPVEKLELDDVLAEDYSHLLPFAVKGKILSTEEADLLKRALKEKGILVVKLQSGVPLGPAFLIYALLYKYTPIILHAFFPILH